MICLVSFLRSECSKSPLSSHIHPLQIVSILLLYRPSPDPPVHLEHREAYAASYLGVLLSHHFVELLEVNTPVTVLVSVFDHLLDFSSRETLSNALADLRELFHSEGPLGVLVEDLEELLQAGLVVAITVEAEDLQEGLEIHLGVRRLCLDDVEDFSCFFLKAECLDGCGEFLCGHVATLVVVEDIEALFESHDVIGGEVLGGVDMGVKSGWLFGHGGDLHVGRGTERSGDFVDI